MHIEGVASLSKADPRNLKTRKTSKIPHPRKLLHLKKFPLYIRGCVCVCARERERERGREREKERERERGREGERERERERESFHHLQAGGDAGRCEIAVIKCQRSLYR